METVERAIRAAAKARQSRIETRHRLRTAQGKAIWVHSWGECQRERGRCGRILTFWGGTLALGVEELTLFHALDEITSCFVFVKDRELRFRLVNQAVADAFGRTKEEIIGKTDAELSSEKAEVRFFNEADVKVLGERIIGGVHSGGRLAIDEEVFTDVNGNKRYLATIKRPITVPSGEIWLLGIATDISDVRKLRREVLHLTARVHLQSKGFERILEGIKHYVWVGDTTGRYVTCNRAFAKLFGLKDAKEVFGKSDAALWSDDDAVRLQDECKRLLSSPQDDKDRCEHRTLKSGCRVRLIERRIVLCGPSNEPVGILGIGKAGANELSEPDRVQQLSSAIDRSASELVSAISTHKELSGVVVAHPRPK